MSQVINQQVRHHREEEDEATRLLPVILMEENELPTVAVIDEWLGESDLLRPPRDLINLLLLRASACCRANDAQEAAKSLARASRLLANVPACQYQRLAEAVELARLQLACALEHPLEASNEASNEGPTPPLRREA